MQKRQKTISYERVELAHGKEAPIKNMHHWIFSKAVRNYPKKFRNGDICEVIDSRNHFLGYGYFNKKPNAIVGRMLNFEKEDPMVSIQKNIRSAKELRNKLFPDESTNAYRLINGEADRVPGLIVDVYNDALVIQISTLGIERIKKEILEMLAIEMDPRVIFEKSTMPSRSYEGLDKFEGIVWKNEKYYDETNVNSTDKQVERLVVNIKENNMLFEVDLVNSHKTGFYLDQRNMRELIGSLSNGKRVLNCFSYTGGFSVAAAKGGARNVTSIDISSEVIDQAKKNFEINNIPLDPHRFEAEDVFTYLDEVTNLNHDIVILDPPAFAKKKADFGAARSGYRRLNRTAMKKMKPGSFLLTCSCSYQMDQESFLGVIKESAEKSNRKVKILQSHRHAMDHTQNLFHGDMDYLKSYLLWIE